SGRHRERAVAADVAAPIGAARADASGERRPAQRRGAIDEVQMIRRRFDREAPEIAGDVPVQFGLGVEEAHLPAGAVLEHVGVFAGLDPRVFVTGIDAEDAVGALGVIGLEMAVAPDGNYAEGHFAQAAARVAKGQREIAVDAVPHRTAFGAHAQRLGDGEFAVLGDLDVRIKGMDDFGGRRFARNGKRGDQGGDAPEPVHDGDGLNWTCGALRSPASASSKKPRAANPPTPAMTLLGNAWTSTLRLRTAPL